jgi:hypothetical protein
MARRSTWLAALCAAALLAVLPAGAGAHGTDDHAGAGATLADHGDELPRGADLALARSAQRRALLTVRAGLATDELAPTWCGTDTPVDDVEHASSAGARFKVVYASPSDQTDRFSSMANVIQADAQAIAGIVAGAAGGTRTIRYDTGTACGPAYVDIMNVRLPRTKASYLSGTLDQRATWLRTDLASAMSTVPGKRNAIVYADWLYAGDGVAGYASFYVDDRPGATNPSNTGSLYGFVFGNGTNAFVNPRRTSVLHEMAHTLGAVQATAPHATGAGHCTDEYDVLCYRDGGPNNAMTFSCGSATDSLFDCGADDYFSPSPLAGTYLATHWNVYNSVFLCPVGSCVAQGASQPVAQQPAASEPPAPALETPPADPAPDAAPDEPAADAGTQDGWDEAGAADPAPTAADARSAVARTLATVRSALRRRGLRALHASFAAPGAGRVEVTVARRARRVARATRSAGTPGRWALVVRPTGAGRRLARARSGRSVAVRVRYAPRRGTAVSAAGRVVAARVP